MTTPAITDKLRKELNRGIASEPRASYLLTEVRKIIERDGARSKYSNLKFHCDWALHSKLDGRAAQASSGSSMPPIRSSETRNLTCTACRPSCEGR